MSKKKDWVGGRASVFKTLGASNHTEHDRSWGDYYATEPAATEWLLKLEQFDAPILEPACGEGHISKVLMRGGVFRHFTRSHRPRLWRGGRFSGHRQHGMARAHRHQPALCLCSGVCGESTPDYPRGKESLHVSQTHFPRRKEPSAFVQDTTASPCVGQQLTSAMRHEW